MRVLRLLAFLSVLAVAAPAQAGPVAIWQPAPDTTWQIQFAGPLETDLGVDAYDVDMEDTDAATVADLQSEGAKVICYINAGAWERWRSDKRDFPKKVLGDPLGGWPGERWLDIRKIAILQPLMEARLDRCEAKGFDAVEFDNVDGYQNRSGFRLRKAHQQAYNEMLAAEAHERGLAVGLKNDLGQIDVLVDDFDFAINEQCLQYNECDMLQPFIDANKAVFHIEYKGELDAICSDPGRPDGFSTIKKNRNLDGFRQPCA